MAEGLKAVESFNATGEPSIVAARWERWRKSFKFYIAALGTVTDAIELGPSKAKMTFRRLPLLTKKSFHISKIEP